MFHPVVNNGTIEVESGSFAEFARGLTCSAGSLLTGSGSVWTVGLGPFNASLGDTIAPGSSTGELQIFAGTGGVIFGPSTELQIELASANSFDVLKIGNAGSLVLDVVH